MLTQLISAKPNPLKTEKYITSNDELRFRQQWQLEAGKYALLLMPIVLDYAIILYMNNHVMRTLGLLLDANLEFRCLVACLIPSNRNPNFLQHSSAICMIYKTYKDEPSYHPKMSKNSIQSFNKSSQKQLDVRAE
ncbi:unnamed protein product [Dovyalis caffra]|uniref:Uncharacterized protein n=1 Tax=Dovyalis caffra TaxID=77055 RepID=A0AAV1SW47_9ROSI|nr:unnamed protein product [Dovyalis caffra]